ncbi:MAG: IS1182 family transposase [Candidatus Nanopelagicales bacterium]|jgi:IS5 family transposase|nr:IS1182 family transposase [Candidatus Nanopelagicales bacterium]
MQGRAGGQRDLWDVESVAGHLLPADSVFAFLAGHRRELFPEEMFADLFPSGRGRPSIPADVIASVIVLQTLNGLSDREAADAATFDLRWKAACGLAVDAPAFHSSTLTYWRRRLAGSAGPHRIFDVVRQVIIETGALQGRHRRALDSTVLDDAVARQDTVTQLIAAVRRVAREVPGAAELVAVHCAGHDYTSAGKPRIAWDDPAAREALVSALVNDALALLAALDITAIEAQGGTPAEAVALLALVAGQDVEPAEDSDGTDGRWRIARRVVEDRVISVVDPDTRHAHKSRERRQDGFKAHLVVEPDTGLTTAVAVTKASGADNSDATVGAALLGADTTLDPGGATVEVLADSAYGTGAMLATLTEAGQVPVIKPWPTRPAVEGGFTGDDFTYDPAAGTLTCPAGVTRTLSAKRRVTFGAACADCPLRARCTTSKRGRKIQVHEHEALQRAHRQRAADPGFQTTYRTHRPMVERSIAWLVRGNRRVPYRGVAKNNAWAHHRVAALNLRRLLTLGLTHTDGAWQLA